MLERIMKLFSNNKVTEEDMTNARRDELFQKLRTGYIDKTRFENDFWEWYWIPFTCGYYYRMVKRDGLWVIRDVFELERGL